MAGRRWTQEECVLLRTLFKDGYSTAAIAARLGRTRGAVHAKINETPGLYRLPRQKGGPIFTMQNVAQLLGLNLSVIVPHCQSGVFPQALARHRYKNAIWRIDADELRAWLHDKRSWSIWRPEQITDDAWRTELWRVRRHWLSTTEARRLLSFSRSGFHRLIKTRRLRGERIGRTYWFKRTAIYHFARVNGISLSETTRLT